MITIQCQKSLLFYSYFTKRESDTKFSASSFFHASSPLSLTSVTNIHSWAAYFSRKFETTPQWNTQGPRPVDTDLWKNMKSKISCQTPYTYLNSQTIYWLNQQVSLVKNVERSNSVVESASSGQYAVRYFLKKCILEAVLRLRDPKLSWPLDPDPE